MLCITHFLYSSVMPSMHTKTQTQVARCDSAFSFVATWILNCLRLEGVFVIDIYSVYLVSASDGLYFPLLVLCCWPIWNPVSCSFTVEAHEMVTCICKSTTDTCTRVKAFWSSSLEGVLFMLSTKKTQVETCEWNLQLQTHWNCFRLLHHCKSVNICRSSVDIGFEWRLLISDGVFFLPRSIHRIRIRRARRGLDFDPHGWSSFTGADSETGVESRCLTRTRKPPEKVVPFSHGWKVMNFANAFQNLHAKIPTSWVSLIPKLVRFLPKIKTKQSLLAKTELYNSFLFVHAEFSFP